MKTFSRIASVLVLMTGAAGLSFAAGTQEPYSVVVSFSNLADETIVGHVDVAVPQNVRDWFQAHGVDGSKLDAPLGALSQGYKDSIDTLVTDSDYRAALDSLINPVLKAALVRSTTEDASMRIGRHVWAATIYGPEDN